MVKEYGGEKEGSINKDSNVSNTIVIKNNNYKMTFTRIMLYDIRKIYEHDLTSV